MPIAPMKRTCSRCGTIFTGYPRSKWCSPRCEYGERQCEGCGATFLLKQGPASRFCSTKCWYAAPGKKVLEPRDCGVCRQTFAPRHADQAFCSGACRNASITTARHWVTCERCDQSFETRREKQRFCSRRCSRLGQGGTAVAIGSRRTQASGYTMIRVATGWRLEHRVVMEGVLGRALLQGENVHHRNGDRSDNRPGNLELWTRVQPSGVRAADYHCPGCRCGEITSHAVASQPPPTKRASARRRSGRRPDGSTRR